jgi:hypothetical protein
MLSVIMLNIIMRNVVAPSNRPLLDIFVIFGTNFFNGTVHIRHQSRKTTVLSCYRFPINCDFDKNEQHLNID